MRVFHLLTGEYPPVCGGVGDHTALLAEGMAAAGDEVHVWCPGVAAARGVPVSLHALPDHFGPATIQALETALDATGGCLLVQYVPNAFGARGGNIAFCRWLRRRGGRSDVRVMFHEPYFYFGWHPARNGLAVMQRLMARHLLRAGQIAYLSSQAWERYLRPYAPRTLRFITLPIPATIPAGAEAGAVAAWRERLAMGDLRAPLVAHFGTYGEHMGAELRRIVPALLAAHPLVRVVCAGRHSDAFAREFKDTGRVTATGPLDPADVAAVLRACDLAVQPYPDGVTTRRTTMMAPLANDVPALSTDGPLTEPVWRESGAVALAPAGDARAIGRMAAALLQDPAARGALGAAGGRLYRRLFSLECTLDRILGVTQAIP